jgi:hypothetical protein
MRPVRTMNILLNNEGQECKMGPTRRTVLVGGGVEWRRQRRENILVYFIYVHENRIMKPVEIVLRRGRRRWRR